MEIDDKVAKVVQIFKSGDVAYQRALLEACPPSRFKEVALSMITPYSRLDTRLTGLSMLAGTYCEGSDSARGITLSKAA